MMITACQLMTGAVEEWKENWQAKWEWRAI
jgi:hypothetical protein